MELQLPPALVLQIHNLDKLEMVAGLDGKNQVFGNCNKRSFDVAFAKSAAASDESSKMLSLLLWNGQPGDGDDDGKGRKRRDFNSSIAKINDAERNVVGWPPIKSWRRKMLHRHQEQHGFDHHHNPLQNQQQEIQCM